jgi:hypothetical protein
VFDQRGALISVFDGAAPAARVDGDAGRLLICEHGQLTVWTALAQDRLAGWAGPWLDAAFVPGRNLIVGLDLMGSAFIASLDEPSRAPRPFALPGAGHRHRP